MRKKICFRSFFIFLICAVLVGQLPVTAFAVTSEQLKNDLSLLQERSDTIQEEIDEIQSQVDANNDEIQALVDKKSAIDREISLLHEQIENVSEQIRMFGQLIANAQEELDGAEVELTDLNAKYAERIRAMEEQGTLSYWEVIFSSRSFFELLDRIAIVDEIAEADQRRLDEIRSASEHVKAARQDLLDQKDGLEASRLTLADAETELDERRAEGDEIIRELVAKGVEFEQMMEKVQKDKQKLLDEIARVEARYEEVKGQEELIKQIQAGQHPTAGSWITPVTGYVITSPFGNRESPTAGASTYHQGVDFSLSEGSPIYASRAGTVTTATYSNSCGNYVTISHGDGFSSIYMHMLRSCVSTGQTVSQGQVIGYVGNTGISTGPHLHFGISAGGTYVNPMNYL